MERTERLVEYVSRQYTSTENSVKYVANKLRSKVRWKLLS